MHELSLAQSVIHAIETDAERRGMSHVRQVTVRVGEWSSVLPESLSASFEILTSLEGPRFEGTVLRILREPAAGLCSTCGASFPVGETGLICPNCGGAARLTQGIELEIESYEGE